MVNKGAELEALILKMLEKKEQISSRDVAKEAGLSITDAAGRKIIQRTLGKLIQKRIIQRKGQARAQVYVAYKIETEVIVPDNFQHISLSTESTRLLKYLAKPIQARKPGSYEQNFLKSYQPNKTFYLNNSLQSTLAKIGRVENGVHPAGTYARIILNRLLIDLSWNSSRLEGNTYSLLETKRLIEFGQQAIGKETIETQMILNHKNAIEYIVESVNEKKITSHEVRSIHALLSENLLGDPSASGRIREMAVGISGTTYIPLANPHVLKENFELIIEKINAIKNPFEQSFFSLVQLSYLQAFEDVNKRTARLVANIPFIKKNLKPLCFFDVDQKDYAHALLGIYEKNDISLLRELYIWAYERSAQRYSAVQQAMGEPNLFKMKYRNEIQQIVRSIILGKTSGHQLIMTIKKFIAKLNLPAQDSLYLFQVIEVEIISLHDGNIARYKIRPSEFQQWKVSNEKS